MADHTAQSETGAAGSEGSAFRSIVDRHERPFRTVGEMAYEMIREGILTGVFRPGERLRQDQLAEAIGVSRIPVRSALQKLESQGLITFQPNHGAVVNSLTIDEVREIYEIRAVLEVHALRKSMRAMTPERLERIERLAYSLNDVEGAEEFLQRRTDFYRELYDRRRQPQLVALIERLREEVARYSVEHKVDYVRRPGERDHTEVLAFLRSGDVEGAVHWLQDHLERVCAQLVARLEEAEPVRS
jgi:DNA-binding GntR family transcriptional regulator